MTTVLTPELTAHWDEPDSFTLAGYRRVGGYQALPKALRMQPDEVIATVKQSGLRGRVRSEHGRHRRAERGP